MIESNEPIIEKLRELKEKSGLTSAQISKNTKGELPESTINRIFMGKTKNPTIVTIVALAQAMGFEAADVFEKTMKVDVHAETPQVVVPTIDANVYNQMIQMYKDIIQTNELKYNDIIKTKDRLIRGLTCMMLFFVVLSAISIGICLGN